VSPDAGQPPAPRRSAPIQRLAEGAGRLGDGGDVAAGDRVADQEVADADVAERRDVVRRELAIGRDDDRLAAGGDGLDAELEPQQVVEAEGRSASVP
jgi:hypothetical protein